MPEIVFKGKEYVYNHHLTVPYRPLLADAAQGIGPGDLASNLIIHGDNLHANDTVYKQALMARLTQAFADDSLVRVGGLELLGPEQALLCDLVLQGDWRGALNARIFASAPA